MSSRDDVVVAMDDMRTSRLDGSNNLFSLLERDSENASTLRRSKEEDITAVANAVRSERPILLLICIRA